MVFTAPDQMELQTISAADPRPDQVVLTTILTTVSPSTEFIELAAITHHGISTTMLASGDTAVVIGQGLIGAQATRWPQRHGVRVVVANLVTERLILARAWGARAWSTRGNFWLHPYQSA